MTVLIDDLHVINELTHIKSNHARDALSFSHGGHLLCAASQNRVHVFNTYTGLAHARCGSLRGHDDTVVAVVWSDDDSELFTAGLDGCILRWSVRSGQCKGRYVDPLLQWKKMSAIPGQQGAVIAVGIDSDQGTTTVYELFFADAKAAPGGGGGGFAAIAGGGEEGNDAEGVGGAAASGRASPRSPGKGGESDSMPEAVVVSTMMFDSVDSISAVVVSGEHRTLFAGTAITQRPGCVRTFALDRLGGAGAAGASATATGASGRPLTGTGRSVAGDATLGATVGAGGDGEGGDGMGGAGVAGEGKKMLLHSSNVIALCLSCDENLLFSVGDDGALCTYNVTGSGSGKGSKGGRQQKSRAQESTSFLTSVGIPQATLTALGLGGSLGMGGGSDDVLVTRALLGSQDRRVRELVSEAQELQIRNERQLAEHAATFRDTLELVRKQNTRKLEISRAQFKKLEDEELTMRKSNECSIDTKLNSHSSEVDDLNRSYKQKIEAEQKRRTDLVAAHQTKMKQWREEEALSVKGSATLVEALHAKYVGGALVSLSQSRRLGLVLSPRSLAHRNAARLDLSLSLSLSPASSSRYKAKIGSEETEQARLAAASKEVATAFEVARQTIEDDADVEIQGLRFKLAGSLRAEQEMTAELIVENNRLKRKQKSLHETSGKQVRARALLLRIAPRSSDRAASVRHHPPSLTISHQLRSALPPLVRTHVPRTTHHPHAARASEGVRGDRGRPLRNDAVAGKRHRGAQ